MPETWVTPRIWTAGERVSASKMNEISTDFRVLKAFLRAGIMVSLGSATVPDGWLLCDGSAVSRTTYADLFAAIGTTWGAGDGSTTFNLPDFRGRTSIGAGQGAGLTNRVLGATSGEETHVLTAAEMPVHNHTYQDYSGVQNTVGGAQTAAYNIPSSNGSGNAGGGAAHNNMQPFGVVNVIIKT